MSKLIVKNRFVINGLLHPPATAATTHIQDEHKRYKGKPAVGHFHYLVPVFPLTEVR